MPNSSSKRIQNKGGPCSQFIFWMLTSLLSKWSHQVACIITIKGHRKKKAILMKLFLSSKGFPVRSLGMDMPAWNTASSSLFDYVVVIIVLPWNWHSTWKWMVGRLLSFCEGLFLGATLVRGEVMCFFLNQLLDTYEILPSSKFWIYLGTTPHPVTVTTRIMQFLVGNPYKPSFVTVTGWGVDRRYIQWTAIPCLPEKFKSLCFYHPLLP